MSASNSRPWAEAWTGRELDGELGGRGGVGEREGRERRCDPGAGAGGADGHAPAERERRVRTALRPPAPRPAERRCPAPRALARRAAGPSPPDPARPRLAPPARRAVRAGRTGGPRPSLPRRERRGLEDVRLGLGLRRLRPAPLGGRELLPLQRLHPVTQLRDLPFERQAPALGGLTQRSLDGRALEPLALELRLHLAPSDLDLADSQLGLGQRFARLADQLEDGSAGRARSLLVGHGRTELVPQSLQRTLDLALHDRALLELGLELLRPLGLLGQPAVGDLHELALELGPLALERRAVALALSLEPGHQLRDDPLALDPRRRGGPFGDLGLHRLCGLDRVRDLATGLRDLLVRLAHPVHPTLGRGLQLGHTGLGRAAGGVGGRDLLLGLGGASAQAFELGRGLARTTLGAVEPATDVQHLLLRAVRAPRPSSPASWRSRCSA